MKWNLALPAGRPLRLVLLRMFTELLVVFVGVYAAYYLATLREARQARLTRIAFYQSFVAELEFMSQQAKGVLHQVEPALQAYQADSSAHPPLPVLPNLFFHNDAYITKSVFSLDHYEALGPNFVANISRGSALITQLESTLASYRQHSYHYLQTMPEPAQLYDPNGQLKPQYAWQLHELKVIQQTATWLISAADEGAIPATKQLIAELEE
jgi:hypothetical protein